MSATRDPEVIAAFEREAWATAAVHSANVVAVYDHGRHDAFSYLVMEWVEGPDLKQVIRERGPLPLAEAVALAQGILHGLAAIHRSGLVHLDVKPQHVLLDDGRPKLIDLGIAELVAGVTPSSDRLFGTAAYLAPERAEHGPVTPAADIYAAGVVLFELLTGQLPFPGRHPLQVMSQHRHDTPPDPRALNAAIPGALAAVVLRALAKDPWQRFATAAEMTAALAAVPRDSGAAERGERGRSTFEAVQQLFSDATAPGWLPILLVSLALLVLLGIVLIAAEQGVGPPESSLPFLLATRQ